MSSAYENGRKYLDSINYGTFKKLYPLGLLRQLANSHDSTSLQVLSNRVSWSIYVEQGKIIYATHSVEPVDRLERHLHRLGAQIPTLSNEIFAQLQVFVEGSHSQLSEHPEYQGIHWLIEQKYLSLAEAALLIQEMVKEVIESFLLIQQGSYKLTNQLHDIPKICRLNIEKILKICQDNLRIWQLMCHNISSAYQRPYLGNTEQTTIEKITNESNLTHWNQGLSIRHLAVISNQDELVLASNIYPYIVEGKIALHEPDPPFDRLPKIVIDTLKTKSINHPDNSSTNIPSLFNSGEVPQVSGTNSQQPQSNLIINDSDCENHQIIPLNLHRGKIYTIVAIDDSLAILKQISHTLSNDIFSVVTIYQPVKALFPIIRHRPDLILLDLNTAGIDGYELCHLIRNNSMLKKAPIVGMTANKGVLNRFKAKILGVSGLLNKPFNGVDLLKMVFTHLT